jgi:hypothetical protein
MMLTPSGPTLRSSKIVPDDPGSTRRRQHQQVNAAASLRLFA